MLCLAMGIRFVFPHSVTAFYVTSLFYGFGQGFTWTTLFAMIPDTVEYGEYRDGERHEGYIYAGASFGTKVGAGLGPVLMGFVLDFGGYVPNAVEQTATASTAILWTSTVLPIAILALGIISMLGYKLDKEYPEIIKALDERKIATVEAE